MAKNIFVGSLPFSTTEDQVGQLFAQFGQVQSVNIIKDKYTGQSRGFAFVEMGSDDETQNAIRGLNGYTLDGRTIVVKEALPKPSHPQGGRSADHRGGFGGGNRRSGGFNDRRQKRY